MILFHRILRYVATTALVTLAAGCAHGARTPTRAASFLIVNARVADGTGGALRDASVRITGDRITTVGSFEPQPGEIGLTIVILSNRSDFDSSQYIDRIADIYMKAMDGR